MKKLIFSILLFCSIYTKAQNSFVFIELFTSQGDETGPIAEEILYRNVESEKKNGVNIFVLEYHVDYWNRLGWKDPLSKFQFTRRQENYSRVLAEKELYTPEIVINGNTSFSGTKEASLKEAIKKAKVQIQQNLFSIKKDSVSKDTLYISYTFSKADQNAVFRLAITENDITTSIKAGENNTKVIKNNYVVRLLHSVDGVKKVAQIKIPLKDVLLNDKTELVGFIQSKQTMKIVAVSSIN